MTSIFHRPGQEVWADPGRMGQTVDRLVASGRPSRLPCIHHCDCNRYEEKKSLYAFRSISSFSVFVLRYCAASILQRSRGQLGFTIVTADGAKPVSLWIPVQSLVTFNAVDMDILSRLGHYIKQAVQG